MQGSISADTMRKISWQMERPFPDKLVAGKKIRTPAKFLPVHNSAGTQSQDRREALPLRYLLMGWSKVGVLASQVPADGLEQSGG